MNEPKAGISAQDIYLFHEGTLCRSYRSFGAHLCEEEGRRGVRFTVWAPHAQRVGIASDWNGWRGESDLLYKIPDSGIWSRFFPDIEEGTFYKYEIMGPDGAVFLKADPYGFSAEVRPATASVVASVDDYKWNDGIWRRKQRAPYQKPLNIYEIHFGTWKQKEDGSFYTYREMADELIPYVQKMGYTHIEIMPLTEHPYDLSWGYQATGYFAPTSRYGQPKDLMYFVDQCHQAGIGVVLDWVPGHFTRDSHGLRLFDGTPLFEYGDPLLADKPGWGTLSFDFSKPEVRSFLISNALYWMDMYHFDGLRVDAVTSMIRLDFEKSEGQYRRNLHGGIENLEAISFLQELNSRVFEYHPHALMMAEESSAWPLVTAPVHEGGLGFNYKWNMGWMNDTLEYIETPFYHRPEKHNLLTFPIVYAYSENFTLPLSHDEVVHGKKSLLDKMPGSYEEKFAGLRVLLAYQLTSPGKSLLFMGGEFGQFIEWRDQGQLDWFLLEYESHRKLQDYSAALNHFYLKEKALWELDHSMDGFQWLTPHDARQSVIAFMRKGRKPGDTLLVVINFQPVTRERYRIGVPRPGNYEEVFNSDQLEYGGSGRVHQAAIKAEKLAWHDQTHSIELSLAPLSVTIWKKQGRATSAAAKAADKPAQSTKRTSRKAKV
ncbi:1,4-alpha-glucan branching enzyme [Paenibacillus sp. CAA11]|uniref:1,4-alpha-glucan branching protein GlgB n=1 Tax=Paenibacillus sp. CAA11 TaxID=1532905 RepID=UPI000D355293|nr:1,4-alpha-glucan branching protein GlgB [Paenibacillus sp. CAA11]AWB46920.1 1,4-alpha-glucan branching enzyme [Paenibacillus sp. CAA11]